MTVRKIIEKNNLNNSIITFRCRAPGETMEQSIKNGGILEGYAQYLDGKIISLDGDNYSIDFEPAGYEITFGYDNRPELIVYEDCKYNNEKFDF